MENKLLSLKILIIIFFNILNMCSVWASGDNANGAILYFSFDNVTTENTNAGVKNSLDRKYIKFVNPVNTKKIPGKQGSALSFDGDPKKRNKSGCIVLSGTGIDFTKSFSIEMWVKFDKDIKVKGFHDILGNAVSTRGPGFRLSISYGKLGFSTGNGKKTWGCRSNSAKIVIPKEKWLHLGVVYNGKKGSIFLNGQKVAESDMTITPGQKKLSIGSHKGGFAYPMNGAIDELKIYNYAKSDLEVSASYLAEM